MDGKAEVFLTAARRGFADQSRPMFANRRPAAAEPTLTACATGSGGCRLEHHGDLAAKLG